jgi:hypothetical protein
MLSATNQIRCATMAARSAGSDMARPAAWQMLRALG